MEKLKSKEYYSSIEGLRAIACLGIILVHIRANTAYEHMGSFLYDRIVDSFTWFVFLFFMISGFGMCSGYLDGFIEGEINLEAFYKRRYAKILPFFGFLLLIAVIAEHNMAAVYEASVEIVLLNGLLPNGELSVLGVCWTLGVIFLFYLLFPAYSVLLKTRKRAWTALAVSLWISFSCSQHLFGENFVTESFTAGHSFIYCIPLFIGGGIIYLYREELKKICVRRRPAVLVLCLLLTVMWYVLPDLDAVLCPKGLVLFGAWLSYAVGAGSGFLSSKIMRLISGISMEMYLSHMVIFRVLEKLHLLYLFGDSEIGGWASCLAVFILILAGTAVFILCYRRVYAAVKNHIESRLYRR